MNGWFITYIVLFAMSLGINLVKHGEPREDEHNFWVSLIAGLINMFIVYMAIKTGI